MIVTEEPNKFMTAEEIMAYLEIKRSTLDKYAREGKLKRFQRGRRTYYLRTQAEKLREPKPKE